MSRLIELLEGAERGAPRPMGFGAASGRVKSSPAIVLVGRVAPDDLPSGDASEARVDAVLVTLRVWDEAVVQRVSEALRDRVWGVEAEGFDAEQVHALAEKGCDFVVFGAEKTPAEVLACDAPGKVIAVGGTLDEDTARAIQELSVDAVFYSPEEAILPLTVRRLIELQKVRGLVDRPFLMTSPLPLGRGELEALRGVGLTGLLVDISNPAGVVSTREAIDALPKEPSKNDRHAALVPRLPGAASFVAAHDDEDEDDEDDYDY